MCGHMFGSIKLDKSRASKPNVKILYRAISCHVHIEGKISWGKEYWCEEFTRHNIKDFGYVDSFWEQLKRY